MKNLIRLLVVSMLALSFTMCTPEEDVFDEALLIGTWKTGTEYYRYDIDYTGATWDIADDVSEEEAQVFEWSLVKAELTQIHIMDMGGRVPKIYTVTELTASSLKYKDNLTGKIIAHTKVR